LNRVRSEALVRRTEELFPDAGDPERAQFCGKKPEVEFPFVGV